MAGYVLVSDAKARNPQVLDTLRQALREPAPDAAPYIQRFLGLELSGPLSQAALEALSIVAYRQPETRSQVEAIRGVNSDSVLRTLMGRELIEEVGRLDQAGRPILYGTTFEFLRQFGLRSVDELPPLEKEKQQE